MRITRIVIPNFQQFSDFDLSLSDPITGKPLDRVCFIGRNGTGKSTLLRVIYDLLGRVANRPPQYAAVATTGGGFGGGGINPVSVIQTASRYQQDEVLAAAKLVTDDRSFWLCSTHGGRFNIYDERFELADWKHLTIGQYALSDSERAEFGENLRWDANKGDLVIFVPPDSAGTFPRGQLLPSTSLNEALRCLRNFPSSMR